VALDNTVEVETPEHIRFRYRVAGPVRRTFAYLLDLVIRLVIAAVVGLVVSLAFGTSAAEAARASRGVILVVLFLVEWGYYVFFETTANGTSPGKRVLSLRVVKEGGYPISFFDSVLRNLLRTADFLPVGYVLGLLAMGADDRFRRLGDRVAGTMVVVEESARVSSPLALIPPLAPGELDAFPQRPPLSAAEREAIELYLRRTDLSQARRAELAEIIAPLLARRMGTSRTDPERFLALLHHRASGADR
jgi:uncharacterized RDD family membrane protein YckC